MSGQQIYRELLLNLKSIIPTGPQVAREALIVLGGLLVAAFILSRFPKLQKFVAQNSLTIKDDKGNTIY
jgi:hypothetical protein